MKKTHKKVFGLFGLVIVAAVTVFAAFLPSPGTRATTTAAVVDTIKVRVVGDTPSIDLDGITPGAVLPDGTQTITIPYENVENVKIDVQYTDVNGNVYNFNLIDAPVNYATGELTATINFLTGEYTYSYTYYDEADEQNHTITIPSGTDPAPVMPHYGYGEYTFEVSGTGAGGVPTTPVEVPFEINPIGGGTSITVEKDAEGNDHYYIDVDYNTDGSGTSTDGQVAWMEVEIYKGTGDNKEKITIDPPLIITAPATRVEIPFEQLGLEDGTYTIEVTAYDANGNVIYKKPAFSFTYDYASGTIPVPHSADTGGMMGNLNISKTDYIITGLIIFGIVGISGAIWISRHDKKVANRRRK